MMLRRELEALADYNAPNRNEYNRLIREAVEDAYGKLPPEERVEIDASVRTLKGLGITDGAALELLYALGCELNEKS